MTQCLETLGAPAPTVHLQVVVGVARCELEACVDSVVMPTWPALPYEDWKPTKQTLHRYAQMVGKVRMALVQPRNHWWHVTLYVSTRGLTTGPMPVGDGRTAEVELDFLGHELRVRSSDGRSAGFALRDRLACAHFYRDLFQALSEVGVDVEIHPEPFDLGDSPAFPDDTEHDSYDANAVERWWAILRATDGVLAGFASRFNGKTSPTQVFWHGLDLAHARYSGRRAPAIEGADAITKEAYSHEVIAFGWWPGDDRRNPYPAFYAYTAPEPGGLAEQPLRPAAAEWQDTGNGSLAVLPYDAMRSAPDPRAALLDFYESAYLAGAGTAGWDLEAFRTPQAGHAF